MLLFLGASLLAGLVVAPVLHTRSVVEEYARSRRPFPPQDEEPFIQRLGGPGSAVDRLRLYLRLPEWAGPRKREAVSLLGFCGRKGKLVYIPAGHIGSSWLMEPREARPAAEKAAGALAELLEDEDAAVRAAAAYGLGWIGPRAGAAAPALEGALKDKDPSVRRAASEALKKIKAAQDRKQTPEGQVKLYSDAEVEEIRSRLSKLKLPMDAKALWKSLGVDRARLPMSVGGGTNQSWSDQTRLSQSHWIRRWGLAGRVTRAEVFQRAEKVEKQQ